MPAGSTLGSHKMQELSKLKNPQQLTCSWISSPSCMWKWAHQGA